VNLISGPLTLDRQAIANLCRQYGVRRLAVFGSAVTDEFDPNRSDVDFLVEFGDDGNDGLETYFGLKWALEELLGRSVDLVAPKAMQNPYFAAEVHRTVEELYAAA
jgi:predicted nucleotidyltransferase